MVSVNVSLLLDQLAKRLRFSELKLNESGRCCIKIDGQFVVTLSYDAKSETFLFSSILGLLPENPDIQRIILHSNTVRWPLDNGKLVVYPNVLRVDPLVYMKSFSINEITPEDFCLSMESFLNEVDRWYKALKALEDSKNQQTERDYILV